MKHILSLFLLSSIVFISSAQQPTPTSKQAGCNDVQVHSTLVSLDNADEQKGFSLQLFETFSMPSGNLIPFTMTLEQGKLYDFNFVATPAYMQYTFTIIDKDNNKLVNVKKKSKSGGDHFLNQNFVAPYSGIYIIVMSQKTKGKGEACGGLGVMKAGDSK